MDDLRPILGYLHEDVNEAIESKKGKQRSGDLTDHELALELWEEEVQGYSAFIEDHDFARSLDRALETDQGLLRTSNEEQTRESEDRRLALSLADADGSFPQRSMQQDATEPESSRRRAAPELPKELCVACTELFSLPFLIQTPCNHRYCTTCVVRLFNASLTDESVFPPRCCRELIPLATVRHLVGEELASQFEEKTIEHNDTNRSYCCVPTCSKYLLPQQIVLNVGTCRACYQRTCILCKKLAHPGKSCPDPDEEVINLGQDEGWQRCYRCKNLIELNVGCNHITCRCGAEFCYICARVWQTCSCPLWDEDRLLARAERLVNRDRAPAQQPAAQAAVQQMVQQVRERHECNHEGQWRRIGGRHQCEECREHYPCYFYECQGCRLRACTRCRHNRL